jgi:hypothetical protein
MIRVTKLHGASEIEAEKNTSFGRIRKERDVDPALTGSGGNQ